MDHIKNTVIKWLTATVRRKEIEIEDLIRAKADPNSLRKPVTQNGSLESDWTRC